MLSPRDRPGRDATASSRSADARSSDPGGIGHEAGPVPSRPQPRPAEPRLASADQPSTTSPKAQRDHIHPQARRDRSPIEPITGRAGLITSVHRAGQLTQPPHRRLNTSTEPHPPQLSRAQIDRRRMRRAGMDIHPHPRHSVHGRTSSRSWGQPESTLRPDKSPRGASGHKTRQSTAHTAACAIWSSAHELEVTQRDPVRGLAVTKLSASAGPRRVGVTAMHSEARGDLALRAGTPGRNMRCARANVTDHKAGGRLGGRGHVLAYATGIIPMPVGSQYRNR
jgi:hypothetical protein